MFKDTLSIVNDALHTPLDLLDWAEFLLSHNYRRWCADVMQACSCECGSDESPGQREGVFESERGEGGSFNQGGEGEKKLLNQLPPSSSSSSVRRQQLIQCGAHTFHLVACNTPSLGVFWTESSRRDTIAVWTQRAAGDALGSFRTEGR